MKLNDNILSQDDIVALSENFKCNEEFRAKQRNKYRHFFQTVISRDDMILEKAQKYGVDINTSEDSVKDEDIIDIDDIVNRIIQVHGFELQSLNQIEREEYIRLKVLPIIKALEKKKYDKARQLTKKLINNTKNINNTEHIKSYEIFKQVLVPLIAHYLKDNNFGEIIDMETCYYNQASLKYNMRIFDLNKNDINELTKPMIIKKMTNLLNNKDGENFIKAYNILKPIINITKEDFKDVPQEVIRHEDIFNAIKEDIIKKMTSFPQNYILRRDLYAKLGIINAEEINKSPEIQEIAKKNLITMMKRNPQNYAQVRDIYSKFGIINADEMNKSPEIQEIAKKNLKPLINRNPQNYVQERDIYVQLGIINAEEMNQIVGYEE